MEASNQPEITQEEQSHNDKVEANANGGVVEGLPSGEEATTNTPDMFYGMDDEWKEANLKDGKLFGKFDSIDAMAKSYQKINDTMAQNGSEAKANTEAQEKAEMQSTVENNQLNEIANNGFDITEDNFKAFEDAGFTREQAELKVMKMEKAANQAYSIVGGKDNYEAMVGWANENLSETQMKAFAHETVGNNFSIKPTGEFAIRGLQAMMGQGSQTQANNSRISGNTPSRAVDGYSSKKEYNADFAYLRQNPLDSNAQRAYEIKMSKTNMSNLR